MAKSIERDSAIGKPWKPNRPGVRASHWRINTGTACRNRVPLALELVASDTKQQLSYNSKVPYSSDFISHGGRQGAKKIGKSMSLFIWLVHVTTEQSYRGVRCLSEFTQGRAALLGMLIN